MEMVDEIIKEYVEQFEKEFKGDPKYIQYLGEMNKIHLKNFTEEDVRNIIQPYLYEWGKMKRVLGKKEFRGWQENIAQQIRSIYERLNSFKEKTLQDTKLDGLEPDIRSCYESLLEIIGKIGTGKVLHLICPTFLPMWDNPIANAISNEALFKNLKTRTPMIRITKSVKEMTQEEKVAAYNAIMHSKYEKQSKEYYLFMLATQLFINNHIKTLSELANKYHKGLLKISDECFWWGATRRPLYLFFK